MQKSIYANDFYLCIYIIKRYCTDLVIFDTGQTEQIFIQLYYYTFRDSGITCSAFDRRLEGDRFESRTHIAA